MNKSFRYNFEWNTYTTYYNNDFIQDFVSINGVMYACRETNMGKNPSIETNYWGFVMEGQPGPKGETGTIFIPSVTSSGDLSWSNNEGLTNPNIVNIKGDKGDRGDTGDKGNRGDRGYTGEKGDKGDRGVQGFGLQYIWNGTLLGIKREDQESYIYVDLRGYQGPKGDRGLKGDKGEIGPIGPIGLTGPSISLKTENISGEEYLQYSYDNINWTTVFDLELLRGAPAKNIDLRSGSTAIEWKYDTETMWNTLVTYNKITGPKGDTISKAYIADDGYLYIWLSSETLPRRTGYVRGDKGEDGREVLLRATNTHLQWKYEGDEYKIWSNIVQINELMNITISGLQLKYLERVVENDPEPGINTTYEVIQLWSHIVEEDGSLGAEIEMISEIQIPIKSLLIDVTYDDVRHVLIFHFQTSTGIETIEIPIELFYEAGSGIELTNSTSGANKVINIKLDTRSIDEGGTETWGDNNDSFLSVDNDGLRITGLIDKLIKSFELFKEEVPGEAPKFKYRITSLNGTLYEAEFPGMNLLADAKYDSNTHTLHLYFYDDINGEYHDIPINLTGLIDVYGVISNGGLGVTSNGFFYIEEQGVIESMLSQELQDLLQSIPTNYMLKSVYDTNNNGIVDRSEIADSVLFSNIIDLPSTLKGYGIVDAAPLSHIGSIGTSEHGLGDGSNAGFSTNDFSIEEKQKLDGIEENAEMNQNAYSNIKVGETIISAISETDTIEFISGENIILNSDNVNKTITIESKGSKIWNISSTITPEYGLEIKNNIKVGDVIIISADNDTAIVIGIDINPENILLYYINYNTLYRSSIDRNGNLAKDKGVWAQTNLPIIPIAKGGTGASTISGAAFNLKTFFLDSPFSQYPYSNLNNLTIGMWFVNSELKLPDSPVQGVNYKIIIAKTYGDTNIYQQIITTSRIYTRYYLNPGWTQWETFIYLSDLNDSYMPKIVYDTDNNGIVDRAEVADYVPFEGIIDLPSTLEGYGIVDAAPLSHIGSTGSDQHGLGDGSNAGFSTNDFSIEEKQKLANLDSSKFLGSFDSIEELLTNYPRSGTGGKWDNFIGEKIGCTADVSIDLLVHQFAYNGTDSWIDMGQTSSDTPAMIKQKYESNENTNAFSDSDKLKLNGIETGAQKNIIEIINVNGYNIDVDPANKIADIFVPTMLSELENDQNFVSSEYVNSVELIGDVNGTLNSDSSSNVFSINTVNRTGGIYRQFDSVYGTDSKWIRIAYSQAKNFSGIIQITNTNIDNTSYSIIFAIISGYDLTTSEIVQLMGTNAIFTKARIVKNLLNNLDTFIDVYYDYSIEESNNLSIDINGINLLHVSGITEGIIPNGYVIDSQLIFAPSGIVSTSFNGPLTGNASTASALRIQRTIFGQSFNGSANVSGIATTDGIIKTGSSDQYVLLGGSGHKAISDFASNSDLNILNNQVTINTSDIVGIQQELNDFAHFKGYFATLEELQAVTAGPNDYAYLAVPIDPSTTANKWVYTNTSGSYQWEDTGIPVPDQTVPKSTTVPLMDGSSEIGDETAYAAGNHRHPTDVTRASKNDIDNLNSIVNNLSFNISTKLSKTGDVMTAYVPDINLGQVRNIWLSSIEPINAIIGDIWLIPE